MATVTVNHVESSVGPTGVQVTFNFSESVSGLTPSDFTVNGISNFRYESGSGNSYGYRFTTTNRDEPGYARIFLPRTAVTPNLDSDLDWTFYWGSDNVISHGATASVRASRTTATLTNVGWVGTQRVNPGDTRAIELEFSQSIDELELSHLTVTGDITTISSFAYYLTFQEYRGNVNLPVSLGDGGEIRIRITNLEAFYPGLAAEEDWTLQWDSDGNVSSSRTADLPVVVTGELSTNYINAGGTLNARFFFSKDISPFLAPLTHFDYTDGIVITGSFSPNNREYGQVFTAPATGSGQGVVTFPADVLPSGNNAVTLTFTYIENVDVDISLSARSAQNGETVIAQFNFDAPVPNFSASNVDVTQRQILAINREVPIANNQVLYVGKQLTVSSALAIDSALRQWQIPIELPQDGEGEIEVQLPEDAVGFRHEAVQAPIFFASVIRLNIPLADNLTLLAVINKNFKHDINITGNNISTVDVQGLLRPFYHQWNPTTGVLSILGRPESYYKDLEFEVIATDRDGTTRAKAKITVIDIAPVIIKPDSPLKFELGKMNSKKVKINNNPSEVTVEGTWAGLDHKIVEEGVEIFGDVPQSGLGITSGNLTVNASNTGGDAPETLIPFNTQSELFSVSGIGFWGITVNRGRIVVFNGSETGDVRYFTPEGESAVSSSGRSYDDTYRFSSHSAWGGVIYDEVNSNPTARISPTDNYYAFRRDAGAIHYVQKLEHRYVGGTTSRADDPSDFFESTSTRLSVSSALPISMTFDKNYLYFLFYEYRSPSDIRVSFYRSNRTGGSFQSRNSNVSTLRFDPSSPTIADAFHPIFADVNTSGLNYIYQWNGSNRFNAFEKSNLAVSGFTSHIDIPTGIMQDLQGNSIADYANDGAGNLYILTTTGKVYHMRIPFRPV